MTHASGDANDFEIVFGAFRLLPQQRLLYRFDTPVRLGARARHILFTLVEHAGQIVSKKHLLTLVWRGAVVQECTLRVHISAIRQALEDEKDGRHFVETVTGLGYRFVAPVSRSPRPRTTTALPMYLNGHELLELQLLREENARLRRVLESRE